MNLELKNIFDLLKDELENIEYKTVYKQFDIVKFKTIIKKIISTTGCINDNGENVFGNVYEKLMDEEIRKSLGKVYTPSFIIEYILNNTIEKEDIVKNPFIKVLDPSCGSGHFLIMVYDVLKRKFKEKIHILSDTYGDEDYEVTKNCERIILKGKDYWKEENIHYHILKHCIYGCDVDNFAICLTIINLILKDMNNFVDDINIINCDSLVKWEDRIDVELEIRKFWGNRYDYVVGNPPYVGHKQLDMDYKKWLLKEYEDVFKDKSDLSYCFFKRIIDVLKENGTASIITTRYFMESPTGKNLRLYLKNNCNIKEIIDFYGCGIFRYIGVASGIFTFENKIDVNNKIQIHKLNKDNYDFSDKMRLENILNDSVFDKISLNQFDLKDERWILIPPNKLSIYNKIESSTDIKLRDITYSFQGIITGCDKAFVLNSDDVEKNRIEKNLLKKWIKNKNISKYIASNSNLKLIYADHIENEKEYENSLSHIENFKNKLENRRECKKGIRKWYHLQWGRDYNLFERNKIIYPYKSENNRFAIDYEGYFFSADVYSFFIKEDYKDVYSLEYIVAILNSKIYDFYFKIFAKKMGEKIYDYYPNSVMDLKILKNSDYEIIENKSKKILKLYADLNINNENLKIKEKIGKLENDIELILAKAFDLTKEDINLIYKELL